MALGILLSCGAKPCGRKKHRCLKMEQAKQRKNNKNHLLHFHYCLLVSRMDDLNMASCTKITFNCLVFSSPLSFVLQNSPHVLLLLSSFQPFKYNNFYGSYIYDLKLDSASPRSQVFFFFFK